ncbi:VOC family protein [Thalassobacillus sp. CUG 92003]|uniref:VOC family protein n=1 Tax=Thalassobacillus sp. CUG 92003 TaxID=2736641 RepID=UPI0015E76D79|nr:VOC family protein [Thalassobacillus sp. CUG 92003]
MATLYPYIFCENAREQADFYLSALGGEIISVQTYDELPEPDPELEGRVMHLVLKSADIHFFLADVTTNSIQSGTQIDLTLEFSGHKDAEEVFNGLQENGRVLMPFEKMFWGAYFGRIEDKYGVRWQIATNS